MDLGLEGTLKYSQIYMPTITSAAINLPSTPLTPKLNDKKIKNDNGKQGQDEGNHIHILRLGPFHWAPLSQIDSNPLHTIIIYPYNS
jgi:hypothetical protein